MIAAVFHPAGATAAREVLRRLSPAPPHTTFVSDSGESLVAAWGDAAAHAKARAVSLGHVTGLDAAVDVTTARCLRGTYSLAAATAAGLLLGRGVLGGRPLYHARLDGGVHVACSRLRPLAALTGRVIDADALAAFVVGVDTDEPSRSLFRGVERVPTCGIVAIGGGRTTTALRNAPPIGDGERWTVDAAAEELWLKLRVSVARALRGRARVAVQASGGLDSTAVLVAALAEARGASRAEVTAMALDFGGPGDDRPYFRELADSLGIVPCRLSPTIGAPLLRSALVVDGLPYPGPPFDLALVEEARRRGAETVLTGAYGDEVFGGSLYAVAFEMNALRAARFMRHLVLPWSQSTASRVWSYVAIPRLKALVPKPLIRLRSARMHRKMVPFAGPTLRRLLAERRRSTARDTSFERTPAHRYARWCVDHPWTSISDYRGQLGAASGIAYADPIADDDLLAFVASLPPSLLAHGGLHRGLLREALRGRIPERLRLRSDKASFEGALEETYRAAGGLRRLSDLVSVPRLAALGIIEPDVFAEEVRRVERAPTADASGPSWRWVITVLAAEAFVASVEDAGAIARGVAAAEASAS